MGANAPIDEGDGEAALDGLVPFGPLSGAGLPTKEYGCSRVTYWVAALMATLSLILEQNKNIIGIGSDDGRFLMNMPLGRSYRLVLRGGVGLAFDEDGVALGAVELVRTHLDARGGRCCAVRSPGEISQVLRAAYGPQPDEIVLRLHRGLRRAAAWIEAGDLGRADVEAVMLGFPDLTQGAMAKLAEIADLEKGGTAWQNQPRIPAGQAGGGEWTADGGGAPTVGNRPVENTSPVQEALRGRLALPLNDGVYRPGIDDPILIPAGGVEGGRGAAPRVERAAGRCHQSAGGVPRPQKCSGLGNPPGAH
ncbi:MAG TPA: hypothetical protein VHY34_12140 [Caulobacteraceae bacterium]|jgi:hypothetical protein|nr:hypothetical protein [Caulobacteraceae bacterium]